MICDIHGELNPPPYNKICYRCEGEKIAYKQVCDSCDASWERTHESKVVFVIEVKS